MTSTQGQQSQPGTTSSNGQHSIAQRLAAIQATKQTQTAALQPTSSPIASRQKELRHLWKILWKWLRGWINPTALLSFMAIVVAVWVATQQNATALQLNQISSRLTTQQANNNQEEATFQAYLDRMADLIENGKLANPHSSAAIRALARAQTLTTLRRLDGKRKGSLVEFLHDAKLINNQNPILSLYRASIEGAVLSNADLRGIDLSNADLRGANLRGAYLNNTSLVNTNLIDADLSNTDLRGAYLKSAYLRGAHLNGAKVDKKQLTQALSLQGAIMPDGSRHP